MHQHAGTRPTTRRDHGRDLEHAKRQLDRAAQMLSSTSLHRIRPTGSTPPVDAALAARLAARTVGAHR